MNFKKEKRKDLYIHDTVLENIFIMEYLPGAGELPIKVYLTALMYADTPEMTNTLIAKHLDISEEEVLGAWNYWESCGVIKKFYKDPEDKFHYTVQFLNLKDRLYSSKGEVSSFSDDGEKAFPEEMDDRLLREVFDHVEELSGRMLENGEAKRIISWIYNDNIPSDLVIYAYSYSNERGKNASKYVATVLENWISEGLYTVDQVKKNLSENDERYHRYKRVMKALGFHRSATEAEQCKIDNWFDNWGFKMDKVLAACQRSSGISNPNINYIDKILADWAGVSKKEKSVEVKKSKGNIIARLKKQYEGIRRKKVAELEAHRKEVYEKAPHIQDIEKEEFKTLKSLSLVTMSGNEGDGESIDRLKDKMAALAEEKRISLIELGLPKDYLVRKYECPICKDTGLLDNGERCQCFKEKLKELMKN